MALQSNFIEAKKTILKSPIISTETGAIVVNQCQDIYGNLLQSSDFGSVGYMTLSPGNSDEEIISFTGLTQNNDGTATINAGITRGLAAKTPYTGGGTAYSHYAGTSVIFQSDNPQLFNSIITYINSLVLAAAVAATDTTYGYVKTTENVTAPRVMSALVSQQSSPGLTLLVQPFAVSANDKDIVFPNGLSQNSPAFSNPATNPRIDVLVFDTVNNILAIRQGSENASITTVNWGTYKPTPTSGDIVLAAVFNRHGETSILERDDNTNGFILKWYIPEVYGITSIIPPGAAMPYFGRTAPTGYYLANGATKAKATDTNLFAALYPSFTVTITIASPGVLTTSGSHGLVAGDQVSFSTTGGLPSGITTGTNYYVIATGLTATNFEIALTPNGPAINTSGSQSGVHTVYWSNYGPYDGTNFYLPDTRGVSLIGAGGASSTVLSFDPTKVSGNVITLPDSDFPVQGQAVVYSTAGTPITGLVSTTTYYVIRLSATTISLATTQANANAGTVISLSGSPAGNQVLTYTTTSRTILGKRFGEETHGSSVTEMSSHAHPGSTLGIGGSPSGSAGSGFANAQSNTVSVSVAAQGGDGQHNNMPPSLLSNFIIKR